MRYMYATLIIILVVVTTIFFLQNMGGVTISFLTMSATLPLALLVVLFYLSGMLTGGSLLALLRSWYRSASRQ